MGLQNKIEIKPFIHVLITTIYRAKKAYKHIANFTSNIIIIYKLVLTGIDR